MLLKVRRDLRKQLSKYHENWRFGVELRKWLTYSMKWQKHQIDQAEFDTAIQKQVSLIMSRL